MVLVLDSESYLALYAKQGKVKLAFFTVSLEKCEFLWRPPNIGILYTVGKFFATSMDSRSLPQNKTLFDSDQLSKFHQFVRKCVTSIQAPLLQMEGNIRTRRLRGIDWHPETAMKVDKNSVSLLLYCVPHTCSILPPWVALWQLGNNLPIFGAPWSFFFGSCGSKCHHCCQSHKGGELTWGEKNKGEREREAQLERDFLGGGREGSRGEVDRGRRSSPELDEALAVICNVNGEKDRGKQRRKRGRGYRLLWLGHMANRLLVLFFLTGNKFPFMPLIKQGKTPNYPRLFNMFS